MLKINFNKKSSSLFATILIKPGTLPALLAEGRRRQTASPPPSRMEKAPDDRRRGPSLFEVERVREENQYSRSSRVTGALKVL